MFHSIARTEKLIKITGDEKSVVKYRDEFNVLFSPRQAGRIVILMQQQIGDWVGEVAARWLP